MSISGLATVLGNAFGRTKYSMAFACSSLISIGTTMVEGSMQGDMFRGFCEELGCTVRIDEFVCISYGFTVFV